MKLSAADFVSACLELTLQTVDDDLQMQLSHALDDGLVGLIVAAVAEGGVLWDDGSTKGAVKGGSTWSTWSTVNMGQHGQHGSTWVNLAIFRYFLCGCPLFF